MLNHLRAMIKTRAEQISQEFLLFIGYLVFAAYNQITHVSLLIVSSILSIIYINYVNVFRIVKNRVN